MKEYKCKVCAFDNYPDQFWDSNIPMYVICPCCGCESGNEDQSIESAKKYREKWINKGTNWFSPKEKPDGWDMVKQLENIPPEWK